MDRKIGYDDFGRMVLSDPARYYFKNGVNGYLEKAPATTAKIFLDNGIGYEVDVTEISKEHLSPYQSITIEVKGKLNKIFGMLNLARLSSGGVPYEKIIFNDPATIVIWKDGTKTIVKCQNGEAYDREKGVAMCFMKKAMGNKGNFNDIFRKCGALEEESLTTTVKKE